jgi:hypothetical protein
MNLIPTLTGWLRVTAEIRCLHSLTPATPWTALYFVCHGGGSEVNLCFRAFNMPGALVSICIKRSRLSLCHAPWIQSYRSVFGLQLPSLGGNSSLTRHRYLLDHTQIA